MLRRCDHARVWKSGNDEYRSACEEAYLNRVSELDKAMRVF